MISKREIAAWVAVSLAVLLVSFVVQQHQHNVQKGLANDKWEIDAGAYGARNVSEASLKDSANVLPRPQDRHLLWCTSPVFSSQSRWAR
ncbi:hypothetical protein WJX75_002749 [Coccomyxa subellipsoidea]|uniref:Uncharacterized protein n=1 Tax=Coccomyxa subellipsoidea TaxID=248742 RepID=A0ABR2Z044_9CHLO